MIHLSPPYHVVEGHTLLPDHADPGLFYAIPPAPTLAFDTRGQPAFSLLQFLGGGIGAQRLEGGLLNLSFELAIPDETLARLQAAVKALTHAPGPVRVVPVLFDEGVVELVAVGASSAPPASGPGTGGDSAATPAPAPPPSGPFRVQFLGSGRPSLGATNAATFQLVVDAPAAELLASTLQSAEVPVIAIFRMAFAGLRPSFEIDVQADWQKVYHELQNRLDANLYYVAADAEVKTVEALERSGVRIDASVFGTGAEGQASYERARTQLLEWVFNRLFVPMVDTTAATANAIGQVVDSTVSSLTRSVIPGVSYRLRMMDDRQLRTLSARMNEAVAEKREVVPQGTLGGLLQRFRLNPDGSVRPGWAALRESLVQRANLDGFPRIEVQVGVEDRFNSDGVAQVGVELRRQDAAGATTNQQAFMLRNASQRETFVVNLLGQADPRLATPYQFRPTVHFNPTHPFGFHAPVTGPWQEGRTRELFVEPRSPETYRVRPVQVALAPTFSFSQFPAVTVELRAGAENTPDFQSGRLVLNQEKPSGTWTYRSFGPTETYDYRATCHRTADLGGAVQGPWIAQAEDWLSVPDPLPRKRTLNIITSLPWPQIQAAFVELRYTDEVNGVHYEEQLDLSAASPLVRRDIPIAESGPRTVAYRLTIFFQNGTLLEGSWRETDDTRVLLDRRVVDSRLVRVRTVGGTLRENHLAQVRIRLQVREPGRDTVRVETEMRIQADQADASFPPWEYLIGDPPVRTVYYDALFVDEQGFTQAAPWRPTEADLIVASLRTQTVVA